jgi:Fibronectin type III domain/IPT/TIG domain
VSSSTGPTAGGNIVDIVGAGFTGATTVTVGDLLASFTVENNNNIRAVVPASDGNCAVGSSQGICAVAVHVTTSAGTSATPTILPAYNGPIVDAPDGALVTSPDCDCEIVAAPEEYDYAPTPTITSVRPSYASAEGGSTETITGTGFNLLDFEWVNVGKAGANDNEDTSYDSISSTQIVVTVFGSATAGTEPVSSPISVQTSGGLSNVSSFDYAGTPILNSISKHLASHDDPGTLTVKGTGLIDVTSVVWEAQGDLSFLTSTSTNITAQTDNQLTVAIPSFFIFPTDVLVCSATGCSTPDPSVDTFQLAYAGRPVLTGSSPKSGAAHGGTTVTLNGALDAEVTGVYFGSAKVEILSQTSDAPSGPIVVVAPAGTAGKKVNITITTLGGTLTSPPEPRSAVTTSAAFTYVTSTPTAPLDVTASAGVKKATVRWRPPSDTGGSKVLRYALTGTAKGHTTVRKSVEASVRSWTFSSLAPHVAWTFTVKAVNAKGAGRSASAKAVRPS